MFARYSEAARQLKKSPTLPGATFLSMFRSAQADQTIEQPVQGLGAIHDHVGVCPFHDLSRGIEQGPRRPGTEVLVGGLSPFLQHGWYLAGRDRLTVHRLDHEVVSLRMGDATIPIPGDTFAPPQSRPD